MLSSFSCRRSTPTPPNTIPASRPFPIGSASLQLEAEWVYQSCGVAEEAAPGAARLAVTTNNTHLKQVPQAFIRKSVSTDGELNQSMSPDDFRPKQESHPMFVVRARLSHVSSRYQQLLMVPISL